MCVCVYVCMCVYVCVYVCMCVCMCVCVYVLFYVMIHHRSHLSLKDIFQSYIPIIISTSPFLGPFATSRFCLRQAYYTATSRLGGTNLADMTLAEDELPLFLKHLFFFHRMYALFDQTFEYDTVLTQKRYMEVLEDFNDRDLRTEGLGEKYAALCEEHNGEGGVTYAVFVEHLATTIFATASAFSTDICAALIEKNTDEMKEHEAALRTSSLRSVEILFTNTDSWLLNVSWYSVRGEGCDTWLQAIESLGNNSFRSILSESCVYLP